MTSEQVFAPGWQPYPAPAPPRRNWWSTAAIALALVLATAALVVALTGRQSAHMPDTSTATAAGDTTAASKALCEAAAPALADSDRITNTYIRLGDPGSAARDQALPQFVTDTNDWISRAQAALDAHPDAQGYLQRSLQQYIDINQTFAATLKPGKLPPVTQRLYEDSNAVYEGPIAVCEGLGVKW